MANNDRTEAVLAWLSRVKVQVHNSSLRRILASRHSGLLALAPQQARKGSSKASRTESEQQPKIIINMETNSEDGLVELSESTPIMGRQHRLATGYMPIESYGLIGNMRTCALVSTDAAIDFMCWPDFDSPSVFCRLLDKDKGGHFSICPKNIGITTCKQNYLPSTNILQTRFLAEEGVLSIIDYFPRPTDHGSSLHMYAASVLDVPRATTPREKGEASRDTKSFCNDPKRWVVRRVESIRGTIDVDVEVLPAFNYARDKHTTSFDKSSGHPVVTFKSNDLSLELVAIPETESTGLSPVIKYRTDTSSSGLGDIVKASFTLQEGQAISFVLRDVSAAEPKISQLSSELLALYQSDTERYWFNWISQSKYKGRWREIVSRSLLLLKLLTYEPTGAIVAAPTFSLPEDFGGGRNWDYRYSWVRDSSFTIYILLRMGFKDEAEAYMDFISDRLKFSRAKDGSLPIMFSIHGSIDLPELELDHLEGYRKSRPVRIGNGAATHRQLDIYGELMDAIYLYNKYGKPVSYDQWVAVRDMIDHVCKIWKQDDMSIWEVRGRTQNFVYSKMMMWVAIDRALRLSEKRMFPCKQRYKWMEVRDDLYEDIMTNGYNKELGAFVQSYESPEILDSAVLIAPLVFFIAPNDPRFTSTLDKILLPPEKGGLTSAGLVYRYNWMKSDDGVGGREGAFSMCTFWLVEALVRAGAYDKKYLVKAINIFESMLGYANHVHMFSEEIARSGEQLGNTPQAFSHLALISAAFNLDRITGGQGGV